ncbi:MAG: hypothetical protein GXP25_01765 [Planctomycetes bacterium]|nr:hypothetical protein [Planctomycetota bacterium]
METSCRIHGRLRVEELEPRTAPVSLAGFDSSAPTRVTPLGDLSLRFDFAAPALADLDVAEELLTVDGTDLSVSEGAPVLPARTVNLLLPQGMDLGDVQVTVSDPTSLGTYSPIIGAAPTLMSESGAGQGDVQGVLSPDWAPRLYDVLGVQRAAGYAIATIVLHPLLFDPITTQALFYPSMTVTANTVQAAAPGDGWVSPMRDNALDRVHLASIVDNPWVLSDFATPGGEGAGGGAGALGASSLPQESYDYVIITSDALAPTFETLRGFKESRGVDTSIVTTSYIYSNYAGVDPAEQVRNFIRDAYSTWGVNYVLLGGDIDVVPHRGAYASTSGYTDNAMPADLYFAALDGSWNGDGDNLWGERNDGDGGGDVDLLAEVYVGRAPVATETEALNFINKTILYETHPPANPRHGLWVGEHLWTDVYGSESLDPIRNQAMPDDYTYTTLYEKDGTFSRANVIDGLNADPHIVNHLGHANQTYVLGIGNSNVAGLTNESPFLVYSQGCHAGAFDRNDSISEVFVNSEHGAFASIMNSRYGWGSTSHTPAYSHDFDMAFFRAMFQDGYTHIGVANQLSKEYNLGRISNSTYRWIYFELNLLGDPQTAIYTGFSVANSDPSDGGCSAVAPTTFTIDFSTQYDPATVDATDLTVNGVAPDRVVQVDIDTLQFVFDVSPVTEVGAQSMHMDEGALLAGGSAVALEAWDAEFTYGPPEITILDSIGPNDDLFLDFGAVPADGPGGRTGTATFTIRNDGLSELVIYSIGLEEGTYYRLSGLPTSSFSIASGASVTGTVTFDPLLAGVKTGTLRIECNDQDESTVDVAVLGVGVSPLVLNQENMRVRFYDLDNDYIGLMYKGDGEAWVATVNGLSPLDDPNQDIGYVGFTGSTDRSMLMVKDMDPKAGGNTLALGAVETMGGESMGIIRLMQKAGTIQNTTIDIGGRLRVLQVFGHATNLDISVGGAAGKVMLMGSVTSSTLDIGGAAGMIQMKKGLSQTAIDVGGALSKAMIFKGMTDSTLTVAGHTTMVIARDGQVDSTLSFNGGADRLMLFGGLDNTDVSAAGNVKKCMIRDGLANGSTLTVTGDVSQAMLFGPKDGDGVDLTSAVTFGSLSKMLMVKGNLAGTVDIQGSCVADGRNSLIRVFGDLNGDLLAGMFGDVMITGRFAGQIGDEGTAAGTGNTLRVFVPGGEGLVAPEGAFADYIGYP